jgi:molybdopterin biosynthesis enzyme
MAEATIVAVEQLVVARGCPILEVKPYQSHQVGVVVTEGLAENLRDRFERAVRQKIGWYGSDIVRFDYVANDDDAVSAAITALMADGATIILTAGGNMMDPLDATLVAMPAIGAEIVRLGAPAHPGSMFWLADLPATNIPIVNLASCSMYSKATVADLVMPWIMAGETVTSADLASIGYGGLLDRDMGWRFPNYDHDSVDEPDET